MAGQSREYDDTMYPPMVKQSHPPDITKHPPKQNVKENITLRVRKGKEAKMILRRSQRRDGISAEQKTGGSITVKLVPGCKFECHKPCPEPNEYSVELKVKVSFEKWNCVPGNTMNTVYALGHQALFTSNQKSILTVAKTPTAQVIGYNLPGVVHALTNRHGYSIAMTRVMKMNDSMELNELEQYIISRNLPMLIVLNMEYSGNQWRKHLVGIIPVKKGDEVEMHIVDGCHPKQKSIPLNEVNFRWCCSGSISFYVEQFAVFTPGKKSVAYLNKGGGLEHQTFYQTKKTTEELLESIPIDYRQSKKRKRM